MPSTGAVRCSLNEVRDDGLHAGHAVVHLPMSTLSTYGRLVSYVNPYRGRLIAGIVAGMLAGGSIFGILTVIPRIINPFVDEAPAAESAVEVDEKGDLEKLADRFGVPIERDDGSITWQFMLLSMIGLPLIMLFKSLATYINRYCMRWVGARVVHDLRNELFEALQNRSLRFWGKADVGETISRSTNDTQMVQHAVATTIADLSRAPFEILAAIIYVVVTAIHQDLIGITGALIVVVPLCVLPVVILGKKVKKYSRKAMERISDIVSRMHETFTGIRIIKACHTESAEAERFRKINANYFRQVLKALRAELLMTPLMEMVGIICACCFLAYAYAINVPMSTIVAMSAAAVLCYRPIKQIAKINNQIQRSVASAERIFELLDTSDEIAESPNAKPITSFTDSIQFDQVSFAYDEGETIVHNIEFRIRKGEFVAFVGETGSGKSTLANLLARFYDPQDGSITLDGIDIREIEIASLRNLIGVVTQDIVLFHETVAANIAYGSPDASMDEIKEAARLADAAGFIEAAEGGYDRIGGEKGFQFSGGQKQRLSIARNILRNPQILILDEATSALDTATEQQVHQQLQRLMENRTVFAIAHRLSTVRDADRIYVLDKGRIVETGTHDELLELNGRYRKLHDLQFGANDT